MITAGVFFGLFVVVTVLVLAGSFASLDLRLTHYLQNRGSFGQDVGLGIFAYLGSIEVTLVVAALIGFSLFRGLRLLAVLPVAFVVLASGLEALGKQVIPSNAPPELLNRTPKILPALTHNVGLYSYPSGHVIRATVTYGLVLYLAERWGLFGENSARLSPILVVAIILIGYAVVYLGWHWFSDALGGMLLGLTLLFGLIAYLERKRTVNPGHAHLDD